MMMFFHLNKIIYTKKIQNQLFRMNNNNKIVDQIMLVLLNYLIFMSQFYKILVEPAKSSKGTCNLCKEKIEQDHLRIQVADDTQLNNYINSNGGRSVFHGQGMSRGGYIQTQSGTISVKKYFVHLKCYKPIKPHTYEHERFKKESFKPKHRDIFQKWLEERQKAKPQLQTSPKPKKQRNIQDSNSQEQYCVKKTKRINKGKKARQ